MHDSVYMIKRTQSEVQDQDQGDCRGALTYLMGWGGNGSGWVTRA